ncbi:MAG: hypothetical protein KKA32_11100 [Actinobacteria bacterium]|nr:hypothetical protein [Actinomycetota bacterium]
MTDPQKNDPTTASETDDPGVAGDPGDPVGPVGPGDPGVPAVRPGLEEAVKGALRCLAEVLEIRLLSDDERARIASLETEAEVGGAAGGMFEFVNEGMREAMACEMAFAALTGPMLEDPPEPWTIMLDDDGQVIGEWLAESRREEVKRSGRAIFLSPDFVLYKDPKPKGKGRFVMPFMCVPLPGSDNDLTTCGMGTPSGLADEYIRDLMGSPGKEVATVVIGINTGSAPKVSSKA